MSVAHSQAVVSVTVTNNSTTTMPQYTFVRLSTTEAGVDLITTSGTVQPYAVTQVAINPSDSGKVAIDGISKLKMSSTAYGTIAVTTPNWIGANASNGKGVRITSTSNHVAALGLTTWAASDIISVRLDLPGHKWGV